MKQTTTTISDEISDLAKQIQAKLGEAFPQNIVQATVFSNGEIRLCLRAACGGHIFEFSTMDKGATTPRALVAAAMERAKGAK